jgi:hypothetical protein
LFENFQQKGREPFRLGAVHFIEKLKIKFTKEKHITGGSLGSELSEFSAVH